MLILNGLEVLHNETVLMRSRDTIRIEGPPTILISIREDANAPGIHVTAEGPNFSIVVSGFVAGTSMTSFATGTLASGRSIVMYTWANRVSELSESAMYQVHCMIGYGH